MINGRLIFVTLLLVKENDILQKDIPTVSTSYLFNPRITNGKDADLSQFPFMAFIHMTLPPYVFNLPICGGVVIDAFWILSSGVCVRTTLTFGTFMVKVGRNYSRNSEIPTQILAIDKRFILEDNNKNSKPNNLGLLKLNDAIAEPVVVKLHKLGITVTDEVYMVGWGKTSTSLFATFPEILQFAKVEVMKNADCRLLLKEMESTLEIYITQICTYIPGKPTTACTGDGGSPLITYYNSEPYVLGIISRTLYPCGQVGAPTVSTRVLHFIDWIQETMKSSANPLESSKPIIDDLINPFLVNIL